MAAAIILLLCLSSTLHVSLSLSEGEALMKFKESLAPTIYLDSWNPHLPPCDEVAPWAGVVCTDGIVSDIRLGEMELSGSVDVDALRELHGLRTINLNDNSFSGLIPEFNRIGELKALFLSSNNFSGEIAPDYFSNMSSLKKIWLSGNQFTGKIPDSLSKLPRLVELHLENNQFSGPIPPFEQASLLNSFDLSNNTLEGEVPASLSRFNTSSFRGNVGLCGKLVNAECKAKVQVPSSPSPPQQILGQQGALPQQGGQGNGRVTVAVGGGVAAIIVGALVFAFIIRKRNDSNDFHKLSKDNVADFVEISVAGSSQGSSIASSRKVGNGSSSRGSRVGSRSISYRRGSSSKKGKPVTGDLMMLNEEKGVFGLSDLMTAAAEVLGNGVLGSAYKAVMANGVLVVVKRMKDMNRLGREGFDAEIKQFGTLHHPNILTPLAYYYRKEEKLLISEYVPKGSLFYVLHGDRGQCHAHLNWPTRLTIVKGISRGLKYLQAQFPSSDLPHGNLKSSNVLLSTNYEPLLSDYGFYPLINSAQASQALFGLKAPEYLLHQDATPKCDIYCLGIVILELLTGKFPCQYLTNGQGGTDIVQWAHSTVSEDRPLEELIDPEMMNSQDALANMEKLIRIGVACTKSDPQQRPNLEEAIRRIEEVRV